MGGRKQGLKVSLGSEDALGGQQNSRTTIIIALPPTRQRESQWMVMDNQQLDVLQS